MLDIYFKMKKLGIAVFILLILGSVGYFFFIKLGGNTPILLSVVSDAPSTLIGKTYRGTPQDPKLGETFREIEQLQSLNPGTKIHTIYYIEPAGKLDTMEVFVGLDLPFATGELETKAFQENQYISAKLIANKWVMPGPEKVKEEIREFAKSKNLTLKGIFIDKITSESEVEVIAPVE